MAAAETAERSEVVADVAATSSERLKGKEITIDGERLMIGKLGLNQWIGLTRVGAKFLARVDKETLSTLLAQGEALKANPAAGGGRDIASLIEKVLDVLEPELIAQLLGVMVDKPAKWVNEHFDLADFVNALTAVFEVNDPMRIWASFSQAAKRLPSPTSKA